MDDLLYYAYLRSLSKPSSFLLSLLSDPFWTFLFLHHLFSFTVLSYVSFLVVFETCSCFLFLLFQLTFFCHVSVLVTIEALWLPVLEVFI